MAILARGLTRAPTGGLTRGLAGRSARGLILCLMLGPVVAGCAASPRAGLPLPAEAVAVSPRPGMAVPVSRSHSEIVVRAFLRDAAGARREVAGADCRLDAPRYAAAFRSPGRVVVPVPRSGAPALDVSCAAGALAGSARRGIVRDPPGGPGWGPWGPWAADPFWDPWWGDGYRRRSGVTVGLAVGDPFWGYPGGWPRPRRAAFYPDVEVELR